MSGRPWYKRYPGDFVDGTMGLSLEEKGAYSLVLDLIYSRGGPIADDPRYISGVCGCSLRKWSAIREKLISVGKIVVSNGKISNFRADFELETAAKLARNLAESGSKGGRKRAENELDARNNNDLAQGELKLARAKSREDKIREEPPNPPEGGNPPQEVQGESRIGDFEPDLMAAIAMGLSPDRTAHEAAKFRAHWLAASGKAAIKADWPAAWRKWVLDAIDWQASRARSPSTGPPAPGRPETDEELLARRKRERDEREAREARP